MPNRPPKPHTGIPALWTQVLDAGLWMLDFGPWMLDACKKHLLQSQFPV